MTNTFFKILLYDKTKPLEEQPDVPGDFPTAYLHEDEGFIELKQAPSFYDPDVKRAIIREGRNTAYGSAVDTKRAARVIENEQCGDGLRTLQEINSELVDDNEADQQAGIRLAVEEDEKGSFSITTYTMAELGDIIPIIDPVDGINVEWQVVGIEIVEFNQLGIKYKLSIAPNNTDSVRKKQALAFRYSKSPDRRNAIDASQIEVELTPEEMEEEEP